MACHGLSKKWWSMAEVEATPRIGWKLQYGRMYSKKKHGKHMKKETCICVSSHSLSVDQGVTAPNRAWRYFHEVPGSQVRTKTSQRSTIRLCFKSGCQLRQRIKPFMVKFLPLRWPQDVYRAAPMARPGSTEWSAQAWRKREFEPQWGDPSPTVSGLEPVMKAHM